MREALALFLLWFGVFFSIVGVVGVIRLPDVYTRLHASGKVSTLGLLGLLTAASVITPEIIPKALALFVFMLLSAPVASHAIALSSYRSGTGMKDPVRDDLAERSQNKNG